jgi:hypothetical protein
MPQTPEYTVRLRTPQEHQREKETPEPLTSAGASGKGRMPMWRSPAVECSFVVQALMAHRRGRCRRCTNISVCTGITNSAHKLQDI